MDKARVAQEERIDHDEDEHQHICYGGVVYIGHIVEEDGEEVEVVEAYACRRCSREGL